MNCQLDAPAGLTTGKNSDIHSVGGWMGPGALPDLYFWFSVFQEDEPGGRAV